MVRKVVIMDAAGKIIGVIGIVILMIFFLAMTPTVINQVGNVSTAGWTFTGHAGAATLLGLVPFVWVAMILIAGVVGMFALAKEGM